VLTVKNKEVVAVVIAVVEEMISESINKIH